MEISIGSYKCRLEICLLIVVLFWVMFGHVMCSCCTMSMREGLEMFRSRVEKIADKKNPNTIAIHNKEGFVGSNNKAYGPEFSASKSAGYIMRPDTWAMPTLSYSKGTTPSAGAQEILNRNNPPLAPGEMDMFANTPFKPECCPNTFSSSEGCACLDMKQYKMLINRGSNNVPYDIY